MSSHCTSGNFVCCKHAHFLTSGLWCGYTILQNWLYNISVLLGISHGRTLRFCKPFSMTLSNPLIQYFHYSGWMSTIVTGDITKRKSTLLIGNNSASMEVWHFLTCISYYYLRRNRIFWSNYDLTKFFPNEKSTTQFFFYAVFQMLLPMLDNFSPGGLLPPPSRRNYCPYKNKSYMLSYYCYYK